MSEKEILAKLEVAKKDLEKVREKRKKAEEKNQKAWPSFDFHSIKHSEAWTEYKKARDKVKKLSDKLDKLRDNEKYMITNKKLLKILEFYKKNPNECYGAREVDRALGFKDSIEKRSWPTHKCLSDLVDMRQLERCKKGKGFKYKIQNLKDTVGVKLFQHKEDLSNSTLEKIALQAQKAQKDLLNAVLCVFRENKNRSFGPSDITREVGLFKGLKQRIQKKWNFTGRQNDRLAQALINELLNRDQIKRVRSYGRWIGYQYKG